MRSDSLYKCNVKLPYINIGEESLNQLYLDIQDNITNIEEREKYVLNIVKKVLIEKGFSEDKIHYIKAKRTVNPTNGQIEYDIDEDKEAKNKLYHITNSNSVEEITLLDFDDNNIIDYGDMDPDKIELVKQINNLKVENIDLKHAVEYYEKYVAWLEKNYIFILKSPSTLKETFDELVGGEK